MLGGGGQITYTSIMYYSKQFFVGGAKFFSGGGSAPPGFGHGLLNSSTWTGNKARIASDAGQDEANATFRFVVGLDDKKREDAGHVHCVRTEEISSNACESKQQRVSVRCVQLRERVELT